MNLLKLPNQIFKIPAYVDLGRKFALAQHSNIFTYPKALIAPILAVLLSLSVLTRTCPYLRYAAQPYPRPEFALATTEETARTKRTFLHKVKPGTSTRMHSTRPQ